MGDTTGACPSIGSAAAILRRGHHSVCDRYVSATGAEFNYGTRKIALMPLLGSLPSENISWIATSLRPTACWVPSRCRPDLPSALVRCPGEVSLSIQAAALGFIVFFIFNSLGTIELGTQIVLSCIFPVFLLITETMIYSRK